MSAQMAVVTPIGRLTTDAYRAERESIRATYGDSSAEAKALRDQALAKLYQRSGWTQEELAKVEGCSRRIVAYRITFGEFLAFGTNVPTPKNLSEGLFRGYWERTDKANGNERQRFAEVLRLMEDDMRVGKSTAPLKAIGVALVSAFADGKWHALPTIHSHIDAPAEQVNSVLDGMLRKGTYSVLCERRQHGKSHQYKLVKGGGKHIDAAALLQELRPLLDGLYAEGKKNPAHIAGAEVQALTGRIEKLIERLAK